MNTPKKLSRAIPLVALLLLCFGLVGCYSTKVIVPPITENAAQLKQPGKFVWFDLFSTDMTSCENFYGALFGWEFGRTNEYDPGVKTVFLDGKPIANMIGRLADPGDSQWLGYISTTDVDGGLAVAEANGGKIYRAAKDLPARGRVGIGIDPQGAPFALVNSPIGDPVDDGLKPNRFIGCELWTTDADAAVKFYSILAGYEVKVVDVRDDIQYRMLTINGKRRGGVVQIPWEGMQPEWLPYVAVENILAVLTKVEAQGGKVLIAPNMDVKEGRMAVVADPSGAVIGLHQMK